MNPQNRVSVLAPDGKPLMPCHPARARQLLKTGEGKVVSTTPFTIQLTREPSGHIKQEMVLGIDDGAKAGGIAVRQVRAKKPDLIVFSGEINLENDIKKRMDTRRNYRRARRYLLRYRSKRFDNRKPAKCHVCGQNARKGSDVCRHHAGMPHPPLGIPKRHDHHKPRQVWLPPSIKAKKDRILRAAEKLHNLFPLSRVVVETGRFDLQKLSRPNISGIDYQKGPRYEKDSLKAALAFEYSWRCQYCGKETRDLEVEHIHPRSRGGTDAWENLTLACEECNRRKGSRTPEESGMPLLQKPVRFDRSRVYRYATWLQQGKHYLRSGFPAMGLPIGFTYGTFTSWVRKAWEGIHGETPAFPKGHAEDAAIIACTDYEAGVAPAMPVPTAGKARILCRAARTCPVFKATIFSPNGPFPSWASQDRRVSVRHGVRVRVETNKALVLQNGKVRLIRGRDPVPAGAFRKGDLVKLVGDKWAEVIGIMSRGTLKIRLGDRKSEVSPRKILGRIAAASVRFVMGV